MTNDIVLSKKGKGYKLDYDAYLTDKPDYSAGKTSVQLRRESIMTG